MKKSTTEDRNLWSKFTWDSWRADNGLRLVSLAARGLWIELLAIAHHGTPYGHVTHNGRAPTMAELVGLVGGGCSTENMAGWLAELEQNGLLSRTEKGWIL